MGMGRGPTSRSLIEMLDRVIGRGVVIDSDLPVSPTLAGLRRAARARDEPAIAAADVLEPPAEAERIAAGDDGATLSPADGRRAEAGPRAAG